MGAWWAEKKSIPSIILSEHQKARAAFVKAWQK